MPSPTLTLRQLNRATLARQMLLARDGATALRAVERLGGLQAQLARPPFVGLWSRLRDFRREALTKLILTRKVVRAPAMRHTLHLMSAKDYAGFRTTIQPALSRGMQSVLAKRLDGLDVDAAVAAGRSFFREPASFKVFRERLGGIEGEERALAYAVRTLLPLVQVPSETAWGYPGTPEYTLAESWLGRKPVATVRAKQLVLRYLEAFGPATPADMQTWSGLPAQREVFERLRPELKTFRDDRGRELYDLPRAPRPQANAVAPVRFLPDFDNLVLAHEDRIRIIADEHRPLVSTRNLRVLPTFLVDGFVAGTWELEASRREVTIRVKPFDKLPKRAQDELTTEGRALAGFVAPSIEASVLFEFSG